MSSRWPTRSRSTRTSGSTSRTSAAACSSATRMRCGAHSRSCRTTCATPRSTRGSSTSPIWDSSSRGRRARFKLWLSLRRSGSTRSAPRSIAASISPSSPRTIEASDRLELVAPPSLGIVCFRRRDGGDDELELERARRRARAERARPRLVDAGPRTSALRLCILDHAIHAPRRRAVLEFLETAEPARGECRERHMSAIRLSRLEGKTGRPRACRCSARSTLPNSCARPPGEGANGAVG